MNRQPAFMVLRLIWGLALALSLALAKVTPASAALRCYVKAGATGSNTGASWANAYINLQSALGGSPCTVVWVAKGIYKPTAGMDRTISFVLKNGVALYGGFAGTETFLSQRNPAANPTILSGNIGDLGTASDNSFHVVVGSGRNATARLDGFTITAGNANGTELDQYGGGMQNNSGSPTLVNLTLSANSAQYGGGIFGESASPNLINVTFSVNTATRFGGGMLNSAGSNPSLRNVTFASNEAGEGGGMWNSESSPVLVNAVFSGNSGNLGGGMHNDFLSSASLTNVTFTGNSAAWGGGMYSLNSSPNLRAVTFTGNMATSGGGGMYNAGGAASLENVTFAGNSASNLGGAMFNSQSSPNLTNVTLSGNSGAFGGGGMFNEQNSNPIVTNSILYGDTGGEITSSSSSPTVTFSIVQGGFPGAGNLSANPLLKPLGSYGGSTKTMPLSYGSPAIDHGTNTGCPATDQRGILRPQDGDGNLTKVCDIGATESRLLAKSFPSLGAQDGWVLESGENTNVGGTMNVAAETLSVGDSTLRQQGRSILSFNTSILPDTSTVRSAALKIKKAGLAGVDPFMTHGNLLVDVRKGTFSSNAALQLTDFQALASKSAALTILNNPVNGWYSRAMPAANLVYINKLGLTQFRLRFQLDDDNDSVADYVKFYSGNATVLSVRPVLIVRYYIP